MAPSGLPKAPHLVQQVIGGPDVRERLHQLGLDVLHLPHRASRLTCGEEAAAGSGALGLGGLASRRAETSAAVKVMQGEVRDAREQVQCAAKKI